jgi:Zn-dependent protease
VDAIGRRMEKEGAGPAMSQADHALAAASQPARAPGSIGPGASAATGSDSPVAGRSRWGVVAAGVGGAGLFVWKFKFALGFLLTKGKLLLLGLTKTSTLLSMLVSLGVYWTVFGWTFALGLVLSIYVHEMGHVSALRQLGIRATAPMFIPGIGAMVRLKEYPASAREDAKVGLAGPLWGLSASVLAWLAFLLTDLPILAAIARVGAWLNLFNLIPIWQLDGSRGFRALTKQHRWLVAATAGAVWFATAETLFLLVAAVAGYRALATEAPRSSENRTLAEFLLLLAALGWLCTLAVPGT